MLTVQLSATDEGSLMSGQQIKEKYALGDIRQEIGSAMVQNSLHNWGITVK
jgi:hypothetical protein